MGVGVHDAGMLAGCAVECVMMCRGLVLAGGIASLMVLPDGVRVRVRGMVRIWVRQSAFRVEWDLRMLLVALVAVMPWTPVQL